MPHEKYHHGSPPRTLPYPNLTLDRNLIGAVARDVYLRAGVRNVLDVSRKCEECHGVMMWVTNEEFMRKSGMQSLTEMAKTSGDGRWLAMCSSQTCKSGI